METEQLVAMALQEAGLITDTSWLTPALNSANKHDRYIKFWQPHASKITGKFYIVDDVFVTCYKKDAIKIDLHDPTSLQKIIVMANKCLVRQSVGHFDSCGHCPFKKKDNTSAIASLKRHTRNRDDLY
jgi:hypothetical protein